jgi:hypothetical protein
MRRRVPGLRNAATGETQDIPDGLFLVRVEQATYRSRGEKPFLVLNLTVLEPRQFSGRSISARLYCTAKALWKLIWFLRDFGYDADLLERDEIDDKAITGLQGVVKITHNIVSGRTYLNLDGFAQTTDWQDFQMEKAG